MAPLFSKVDLNKLRHGVANEETLICAKFGKDLFNISKVIGRKNVAQFSWLTVYIPTIYIHDIFTRFLLCFIFSNSCWGFIFVLLWQTSMNALIIMATATHRRSAPTRLEASPVPVLKDILATGSPVQVTNERLFYILPYFENFSGL